MAPPRTPGAGVRAFATGLAGSTLPLLVAFGVAALRPPDADLALLVGGLAATGVDLYLFVTAFAGLFRRAPEGAGLMAGLLIGALLGCGGCALLVGALP